MNKWEYIGNDCNIDDRKAHGYILHPKGRDIREWVGVYQELVNRDIWAFSTHVKRFVAHGKLDTKDVEEAKAVALVLHRME